MINAFDISLHIIQTVVDKTLFKINEIGIKFKSTMISMQPVWILTLKYGRIVFYIVARVFIS